MLVDLADRDALLRVDLEQTSEKVTGLCRDVFLQQVLAFEDELVELVHRLRLERHSSVEHCEQDNACTPQIDIEAVAAVPQNFRRDVGRRTALLAHDLVRLDLSRDAKVGNLDVTFAVKQYVVQLDVSVGHVLRVDVTQAVDDLPENLLRERLLQSASLSDIVEQVAASAQLHDDDDVFLSLERLVDLDHVVVPQLQQQVHFFHQLRLLHFVSQVRLVQRFEGHQLSDQLVHGQVDFAEGAAAEHFADPVESDVRGGRLLRGQERLFDLLHDRADLLGAGAEFGELTLDLDCLLGADDLAVEGLLVDVRGDSSDLLLVFLRDEAAVLSVRAQSVWLLDCVGLVHAVLGPARSIGLRLAHLC